MSNKILGIPSRLIASPVNQVYFRTAVDLHDDTKRLAKFSLGLVQKIYLAAAPLIIILIALASRFFPLYWEANGQKLERLRQCYLFNTFSSLHNMHELLQSRLK